MTATALPPLPMRHDTFLGVCQAIEEDFGFSGNWLRVALGAAVLLSPMLAFAAYGALGLAVGLSRLIAPVPAMPRAAAIALPEAELPEPAEPMALAA